MKTLIVSPIALFIFYRLYCLIARFAAIYVRFNGFVHSLIK